MTHVPGTAAVSDSPDGVLIEEAKKDPEAFGAIVKRYWDPLFRYVRRIASFPDEDIEDILQETFINTYRKLNEYESDMPLGSFLYRVAHNQAIDAIRRSSARPKPVYLEDDDWREMFVAVTDIEGENVTKACIDSIREAISGMPERYREALVLRFLEEKSYEEIMDILEKPKGSVATLIARGREILLKRLRETHSPCISDERV